MPRGIYVHKSADPSIRFLAKVNKDGPIHPTLGTACWLWTASIDLGGYGQFYYRGARGKAHRFAYESAVGPIPDGLQLDHLCRVRSCVNPAHLEAVTMLENIRRGEGGSNFRLKTHCPKGHPYSGDNLYVSIDAAGQRRRHCRTCCIVRCAAMRASGYDRRKA